MGSQCPVKKDMVLLDQSKQFSVSRVKGTRTTPHAASLPLVEPSLLPQLLAGPLPTALSTPPAALGTPTTPAPLASPP
ncbi:hypothetical protein C0989_003383 [Termitomyces sp. Mn162]|nr:hypothetical protein C0989_003383 [Termitomyces sp. Mn162]